MFVTTQSIKKLKKFLEEWALDTKGWWIPGSHKEVNLTAIFANKNATKTYYKERWIMKNDIEQRLIVTYSRVYARYQTAIRNKQVERALKKIERPNAIIKPRQNDPKRFIEARHVTEDGEIAEKTQATLNREHIDKEAMYDGFYAVCTNLESTIEEIIQINQGQWEIEETFRIMTSDEILPGLEVMTAIRVDK